MEKKEINWDEVISWDRILKVIIFSLVVIMMPFASCTYDMNKDKVFKERLDIAVEKVRKEQN